MGIFKNKKEAEEGVNAAFPRHIAVILDGNGRWAKARGLPRTVGHAAGAETFRRIATYCRDIGVEYLTVYAFSTENWKRPKEEIDAIMGLLAKYLREAVGKMEKDHIRLKVFGDASILPGDLQLLIRETADISRRYDGFQANVCINYGGRDEIVRAAMRYAEDYKAGRAPALTEEAFTGYMYSAGIPDPDIVIRPGGELRLSNFLMWESAYSELIFTDVLWPDFTPADIDAAVAEYQRRERRFGAIKVENG
ncbi:MAG TPA: di-trans,poly-cis-decaprenylcistransferase [Clostridiales bacterium]|jgi:undecaprenyl diphosphate synthase|nr:di-trans,poly-cis-decaprenylcistransferase [Clostridiales bacterium]HBR09308.1 di-trans,poly-cis-decaprenylcistransferase [Clostridiales bacterium]